MFWKVKDHCNFERDTLKKIEYNYCTGYIEKWGGEIEEEEEDRKDTNTNPFNYFIQQGSPPLLLLFVFVLSLL